MAESDTPSPRDTHNTTTTSEQHKGHGHCLDSQCMVLLSLNTAGDGGPGRPARCCSVRVLLMAPHACMSCRGHSHREASYCVPACMAAMNKCIGPCALNKVSVGSGLQFHSKQDFSRPVPHCLRAPSNVGFSSLFVFPAPGSGPAAPSLKNKNLQPSVIWRWVEGGGGA